MKKTAKPKQKFSKAQVAAHNKFAAAGRASQARARSKPGYKPSKAQHRAGLDWARAGRRSQARAKAGLPPVKKKLSQGDVACCAAEAIAVSLRLHGAHVAEEDMLRLYWQFAEGPDDGVLLGDMLAAGAIPRRLTGRIPSAHRTGPRPVSLRNGMILGWDSWDGLDAHAGVFWDGKVISWGELHDMPSQPDEAWAVSW